MKHLIMQFSPPPSNKVLRERRRSIL